MRRAARFPGRHSAAQLPARLRLTRPPTALRASSFAKRGFLQSLGGSLRSPSKPSQKPSVLQTVGGLFAPRASSSPRKSPARYPHAARSAAHGATVGRRWRERSFSAAAAAGKSPIPPASNHTHAISFSISLSKREHLFAFSLSHASRGHFCNTFLTFFRKTLDSARSIC